MLLLAALWGSSFLFMRISVREFGPLPTAAVRVGIAALMLLAIAAWRGVLPQLRQHWRLVFAVGILNSAIPFASFAFALQTITTGLSAILNATTPMFGALVAWLWLRDKPDGWRIVGLLLGFTGVAMLTWEKATFHPDASGIAPGWAVLACLLACICYAVAASFTKKYLTGIDPLVTATGSQIGATLGLALPAALLWPTQMPSAAAWAAGTVTGVLCSGLAYILFFRLIARAGPQKTLSVTFLIPVFAVFYGAVFIGETITPWMVICALVIVAGTALSTGLIKPRLRSGP